MKDTYTEHENATTETNGNPTLSPVEKDRQKMVQQGYGAMTIAMSMAGGTHENSKEPRIVTYARMFVILFAMLLPSLLLIRVVL